MMKKFFLANAVLLALSITGAWADDFISHGGVIYRTTGVPTNVEGESTTEGAINYDINGYTSGTLSVSGTTTTTTQVASSIDVIATSIDQTSDQKYTPIFSSWTTDPVEKNRTESNQNNTYQIVNNLSDLSGYKKSIDKFIAQGFSFVTWEQVEDSVEKYDDYEVEYYFYNVTKGKYRPKRAAEEIENIYPNYENVYYYLDIDDDEKYITIYSIYKIADTSNEITLDMVTTTYNPKTIPADFSGTEVVTSITIGATIDSIGSGAFKNAYSLTNITIPTTTNFATFTFNKTKKVLYRKLTRPTRYEIILFTSNVESGEINLTNVRVNKIREYATYSLSDMIIYTDHEITVEGNQGSGVHIINTSAPAVMTLQEDYGYKVEPGTFINQTKVEAAIENYIADAKYLDFRGAKIEGNINIDTNHDNKIIIFGDVFDGENTYQRTGVNVVYKDGDSYTCNNFELKDNNNDKEFFIPSGLSFTANEASYDREFDVNYATICLPFQYNDTPDGFRVGRLKQYNAEDNSFEFVEVYGSMTAYTPYIIYFNNNEGTSTLPTLHNIKINSTDLLNNGQYFKGVLTPTNVTSVDGGNMIYGFSKNTGNLAHLGIGKSTTIKTFRAYLQAPAANFSNSGSATYRFVSEEENGEVSGISTIDEEKKNDNIYNLNGQRVNDTSASGLYIKNGKKIIIKK